MSDFTAANEVYKSYFATSPPSRATVSVPLPTGQRVKLEVIGFDDRPSSSHDRLVGGRRALHVQSLSYWAPANIGPYSQAVIVCLQSRVLDNVPMDVSGERASSPCWPDPTLASVPNTPASSAAINIAVPTSSSTDAAARQEDRRGLAQYEFDWRGMVRVG